MDNERKEGRTLKDEGPVAEDDEDEENDDVLVLRPNGHTARNSD
jgi:hypothetical protein